MPEKFRAKAVAEAAGVIHETLATWVKQGLFEGRGEAPGQGKARGFSFADAVAVRVMRELTDRGITASEARKMVRDMWGHIDAIAEGGAWAVARDGSRVAVDHDPLSDERDRLYLHYWETCEGRPTSGFVVGAGEVVLQKLSTGPEEGFGPITSMVMTNLSELGRDIRSKLERQIS